MLKSFKERVLMVGALFSAKQNLVWAISKLGFEFTGRDSEGAFFQQKKTGLKLYMYK